MSSSLSLQMLAAFDNHRSRADLLLTQYVRQVAPNDIDGFFSAVRRRFFLGVHSAVAEAVLRGLKSKLRTQQEIAEVLGLKDRTSISQMLRSKTIDGKRLTAALYQYPDLTMLPTRERMALAGFARATSFVKALECNDATIEDSMTPQEFAYVVEILASDQWNTAIRDPDLSVIRKLAQHIIQERALEPSPPPASDRRRPEQCVLMLQHLFVEWGDPAAVALRAIPECIPEDDAKQEVPA